MKEFFVYLNYLNNRKELGYKVVEDRTDSIKLVLIIDSTVPMIRNFCSSLRRRKKKTSSIKIKKRKRKFLIGVLLSTVIWTKDAPAVPLPIPPNVTIEIINRSNTGIELDNAGRLQANCHSSNFNNSAWVDSYIDVICQIRGGSLFDKDKVLIKSIINKLDDYKFDRSTVEKIFRKITDASLSVASNQKLMRILTELEKPMSPTLIIPGYSWSG